MTLKRQSLKTKLIVVVVPVLTAMMLLCGTSIYQYCRRALWAEFETAMRNRVRGLAQLVSYEDGGFEFELPREMIPPFKPGPNAEFFIITLPDGKRLAATPGLPSAAMQSAAGHTRGRSMRFEFSVRSEDESTTPVAAARTVRIFYWHSRQALDDTLRILRSALLFSGALLLVAAALALVLAVRRVLRPLDELGTQVGQIDERRLDVRLAPGTKAASELEPVYQKVNDLLARLQGSFERERRFSAAAAHELRTPVAELRSTAEVALRWPDNESGSREALKECLEASQRLESISSALLTLARARSNDPANAGSADLAQAIGTALDEVATKTKEKGCEIKVDAEPGLTVAALPDLLALVLRNLLGNAVEYAPAGDEIAIALRRVGDMGVLSVENSAPGLAPSDAARLFEPFWRADDSRTDSAHTGLGLAVARDVAESLGGTLTACLVPPRLRVDLRLPAN